MKNYLPLNTLGQCAVFTLSPLVVPSLLCTALLVLSIFDESALTIFSIPIVFSMVLGMIPAMIIGFCSGLMRKIFRFKSSKLNILLWLSVSIILNMLFTAKFMSGISQHVVDLAYVMGAVSAVLACCTILLLENFRTNIIFSRAYQKS